MQPFFMNTLVYIFIFLIVLTILVFFAYKIYKNIMFYSLNPESKYYKFYLIKRFYFKSNSITKSNIFTFDDRICDDLNLETLFIKINYTNSTIGQQYLYSKLRTTDNCIYENDLIELESFINNLNENIYKKNIIDQIKKLNSDLDYFLFDALENINLFGIKFYYFIILDALLITSLFLFRINSILFIIILFLFFTISLFYYLKVKFQVYESINLLNRVFILVKVSKKLFNYVDCAENQKVLKLVKKLEKHLFFYKLIKTNNNTGLDPIKLFLFLLKETIKLITHLEFICFYFLLKNKVEIENNICEIINYVGKIDLGLSINELRKNLPYFTLPKLNDNISTIKFKDVYHPIFSHPIANDFELENNNCVITGSNMSGKTSFLKTIAINIILAKVLNTCCAQYAEISNFNIFTSINTNDDIIHGKSLYLQELEVLLEIINLKNKPEFKHLIFIDEIIKGTNYKESTLIASVILNYLSNYSNLTIFVTTHNLELISKLNNKYQINHFTEDIDNNDIYFDYKIKNGFKYNNNAIKLLQILNFPKTITDEIDKYK